jgi:hypothetical protein
LKISKSYFILWFIESTTPGPGAYTPKVNMTLDGVYYLSNYKSSQSRKFASPNQDFETASIAS